MDNKGVSTGFSPFLRSLSTKNTDLRLNYRFFSLKKDVLNLKKDVLNGKEDFLHLKKDVLNRKKDVLRGKKDVSDGKKDVLNEVGGGRPAGITPHPGALGTARPTQRGKISEMRECKRAGRGAESGPRL